MSLLTQKTSVGNLETGAGADEFPVVIATMPANARQRKTAFRGFALLVVVVAIVMPFANIQLARVDAFIPVIQTMMSIAGLLTAAFLFAQYSVQPRFALLALASGFVFNGLFAFLQTLAFPGTYGPGALIGDELNSAGWLFVCWHTTFPLAVIAYVLTKDARETANVSGASTRAAIGITIVCVVAATAGLTWGATAGAEYLPSLYENASEQAAFARIINVYLALLIATTIVLLFISRRTILDQWLIVTLFAWLLNFVVSIWFTVVRFTIGWYMARVYALFAGSSLLFVLFVETLLLYARLANAIVLLQRSEQHQRLLIAELDHRVKNNLAQVSAVVTATRQGTGSIDDFVRSLGGRIQSMAAAHTLLSKSGWQNVGLDALVRTELAPYATGANITVSGTDVMLTSDETQALGKVLHELVTNAAKYGALSIPGGQVSVSWDRNLNEQAAILILEWREHGGPPVASRVQSSYGTDLIRKLIPHELGGTVELVFAAEGVSCRVAVPFQTTLTLSGGKLDA
jgi:two-component sensor histidine kinase